MLTFLGIEPRGLESVSYSSRIVDERALATAQSEAPFAQEAAAALRELHQSVKLVARVRRIDRVGQPRALSRDEAILAGQMVRLAKLHEGLLAFCSPPRMELFAFLLRGAIETSVNLRYLLQNRTVEVYVAYLRDSLRLDKQLHDRIHEVVAARGGAVMPMEHGLLDGIARAFHAAEIDFDSVDSRARPGWTKRGVYGRFESLGSEGMYTSHFAVYSNYVHGAWQELYEHHLTGEAGGFLPDPEFEGLGVAPLVMAIDALAAAAVDYLRDAAPASDERDVLEDRIAFCARKSQVIRAAYRRAAGMPEGT